MSAFSVEWRKLSALAGTAIFSAPASIALLHLHSAWKSHNCSSEHKATITERTGKTFASLEWRQEEISWLWIQNRHASWKREEQQNVWYRNQRKYLSTDKATGIFCESWKEVKPCSCRPLESYHLYTRSQWSHPIHLVRTRGVLHWTITALIRQHHLFKPFLIKENFDLY